MTHIPPELTWMRLKKIRSTVFSVITLKTISVPTLIQWDLMSFPMSFKLQRTNRLSVTYRRIISNNIVNEARYGIFTNEVPFARVSARPAFFLGSAGTTNGVNLAGLISNPDNIFLDQGRNNKTYTLADNLNYIAGKHSLKFGGQFQKYKINSYNDVFIIPNYIIETN